MRIKYPNLGDWRVVHMFAWFPITAPSKDCNEETRWLEKVVIKQEYCGRYTGWKTICFLNY